MSEGTNILNNRYKLIQRAGAGGMSTVYMGQDLLLGRVVAIKMLHQSLTSDGEFLRRFQQEAHSAANLAHPNLVTVHDIGQDGNRYFMVMEFVEGWTLKDLIRMKFERTGSPLTVDLTLALSVQICAGIGYAHRAGLVHCDVKSQNVLVTKDHQVKVTDFGIARAMSEASLHESDQIWGTPQYFSPEQAAGKPATPASDVYSIGVIMFEMLTSRLPFQADTHAALALMHIQETPPSVIRYNPAVPEQIDKIIAKVLSKEPGGRYRTADQLGRVLVAYRENSLQDTGPIQVVSTQRSIHPATTMAKSIVVSEPTRVARQDVDQEPEYIIVEDTYDDEFGPDWTMVGLVALAVISWLGLIPLWYLVYMRYVG